MDIKSIKPNYYTLKSFEFINGRILEDQIVEYITLGTPRYDADGKICNAIIYFHGTTGNYSSINRISSMLVEGKPLSLDDYYFVSLSTLGTPGSSSPSTSGLNNDYPEYGVLDMVNFNRQFLEECLNITHPLGLIGNSMGGFEAVTWATIYPDSIDFLISLVSSYKVGGQNYVISKVMNDIITSDPDFNGGNITGDCKRSLKMASKSMYSFGLSRQFYMDQSISDINKYMDEFAEEDSMEDVLDAYYRNVASMNYDLSSIVSDICVPTLIIGIYEDQYFPPELDAIPMHALIKNSTLVCFNSYMGHVGSSELIKIEPEIVEFMSQFKE